MLDYKEAPVPEAAPPLSAVVTVRGLSYTYPDGQAALRDIDLTVEAGERIALVGPNGAGKSTLLLHLNGILRGQGHVEIAQKARALFGDSLFAAVVEADQVCAPTFPGNILDTTHIIDKGHGVGLRLQQLEIADFVER